MIRQVIWKTVVDCVIIWWHFSVELCFKNGSSKLVCSLISQLMDIISTLLHSHWIFKIPLGKKGTVPAPEWCLEVLISKFPFKSLLPNCSTKTEMSRKYYFYCISVVAYVVLEYQTVDALHKLIVDKTFFRIKLKVFNRNLVSSSKSSDNAK